MRADARPADPHAPRAADLGGIAGTVDVGCAAAATPAR
jgi:hypothetical protein